DAAQLGEAADIDRAARLGELDRVRHEVQQNLHDGATVGHYLQVIGQAVGNQLHARLVRAALDHVDGEADDFAHVQLLDVKLVLSDLYFRHVQNVVDEV